MKLRNLVSPLSAAALAVGLAACSSDSAGSPESGGAGSDTGPIVIGVANMDTGTLAFPGATELAEAAAAHINEDLGGIQGRQVELVTCDLKNDEAAAQQCGQQFANNPDMVAAIVPMDVFGAPFYASMVAAGKPVLGGLPIGAAAGTTEDVYYYYPGNAAYASSMITWITDQSDVETVTLFRGGDPSTTEFIKNITDALEEADIQVNDQIVPVGSANLVSSVVAGDVEDADLVYAGNAGGCGALTEAFKSLDVTPEKVLAQTACADPSLIAKSAADYQNWTIANPIEIPSAGGEDADALNAGWEKHGAGGAVPTYGETGWGALMTLASILEEMPEGDISDPAKIAAALDGFQGPVALGADEVSCPGPTLPFVCSEVASFYSVTADGSLSLDE